MSPNKIGNFWNLGNSPPADISDNSLDQVTIVTFGDIDTEKAAIHVLFDIVDHGVSDGNFQDIREGELLFCNGVDVLKVVDFYRIL